MVTRNELALAVVLILCAAGVAYGQVDRANLNGTVTDSSRAMLADAHVELVSHDSGLKRVVTTGATGTYSIGVYGFATVSTSDSVHGIRSPINCDTGAARLIDQPRSPRARSTT